MKKITFEEAIYLLENKNKVFNKNGDMFYQFNEFGILCSYSCADGRVDSYNLSVNKYTYEFYLPEEPKSFEITKTGLYKTRDGRQAYVYCIEHNLRFYAIDGDKQEHIGELDGTSLCGVSSENPDDIVSEWGD